LRSFLANRIDRCRKSWE